MHMYKRTSHGQGLTEWTVAIAVVAFRTGGIGGGIKMPGPRFPTGRPKESTDG